jgi:CPA1 family monovalent cation:H+ antiporter
MTSEGRGRTISREDTMKPCEHLQEVAVSDFPAPRTPGACEECLAEGTEWVQLRECRTCGHVGCCDSSPRKHATAHFRATQHPVMRSVMPGDTWAWCYVHDVQAELSPARPARVGAER